MSLSYLDKDDFQILNNYLCINVEGAILVMFTSSSCVHCQKFMPEFIKLPKVFNGVKFGVCSLDGQNRKIAIDSHQTQNPITDVPRFFLYYQGNPVAEYTGVRNLNHIVNFLQDVLAKIQKSFGQQSTSFNQRSRVQSNQQTPSSNNNSSPPSNDYNNYIRLSSDGVKEYRTSYGRPYNVANEQDFLEMERAYIAQQSNSQK